MESKERNEEKAYLSMRCKKAVNDMLDDLTGLHPHEGSFHAAKIKMNEIPVNVMMLIFVSLGLPHLERVQKRDANFFLTEKGLFSEMLNPDKFKTMWRKEFDDEDRETLFKHVEKILNLVKKWNDID